MKRLILLTFGINLICYSLGLAAEEETPKESLKRWGDAFLAGKVDAMLKFYESSEELTVVLSTGHQHNGVKAVRQLYQDAFEEVVFDKVALESLQVRQEGNIAWGVCRFKASTTLKPGRRQFQLEVRTSFVLKRIDDAWKIVFEHSSPIADVPRVKELE
jgi:ketosteroid isomerase-like protein